MGAVHCRRQNILNCTRQPKQENAPEPGFNWVEPVRLHIYDVGSTALNAILRPLGTGMFHCGVEVYGWEWAFCDANDPETGSGIFCSTPKRADGYVYRECVPTGHTKCSPLQVRGLLLFLETRWPAQSYDTLRHNCCHFSDEFCRMLGVGGIPEWVMHLAAAGDKLDRKVKVLAETVASPLIGVCCVSGMTDQCDADATECEVIETVLARPALTKGPPPAEHLAFQQPKPMPEFYKYVFREGSLDEPMLRKTEALLPEAS